MAVPLRRNKDATARLGLDRVREMPAAMRQSHRSQEQDAKSDRHQQSEGTKQNERDQLGVVERRDDVIPNRRFSAKPVNPWIGQDQPFTAGKMNTSSEPPLCCRLPT